MVIPLNKSLMFISSLILLQNDILYTSMLNSKILSVIIFFFSCFNMGEFAWCKIKLNDLNNNLAKIQFV